MSQNNSLREMMTVESLATRKGGMIMTMTLTEHPFTFTVYFVQSEDHHT